MDGNINLLQQILLRVPNYVFWKDKNLIYRGCNANFAKSLGFEDINQLVGKTDNEIPGTRAFAKEYQEEDKYILRTGESILSKEVRLSIPNEKDKILSISKVPLYDEQGEIGGILGIYIDISHIKENELILSEAKEKAESANQAKTEFLNNMRHDIRTPLSGIVGFSEILKSESTEPRIQEYAENLIASSHALLNLMDEVLEAVRVSSGDIPKLKKKFNLKQMIEKVIDLHKAKACEKKLHLNFICDKNLPRYVIGDKIRLYRILLELISNALNFTHVGHVTLTAELAKKEQRDLIIKVQVTDSGIGIARDKQQDIYLQFKRLTPSYQGLYKGAGLGLYIVKQFIDEIGAEIYVNSAIGKGSTFSCIIPLQATLLDDDVGVDEDNLIEEGFITPLTPGTPPPYQQEKANKILVVEDNVLAQKVVEKILLAMNCEVDLAANGKEALTQIGQHHYDLIFMDIGLGEGADGYEVMRQIREHEKDKEHTPIVALTAHAAEENKQHCIEAGMDAVLAKPITKIHASNILNAFVRTHEIAKKEKARKAKLDLPDTEEELFALNQFPLLEVEQTLKDLGDKSILIELLHDLIEVSIPQDFMRMKDSFDAKDYEQVEKLAHKMKGGAVYVGTIRMKYACQYLERYRKSGQNELFIKLYHQAVVAIEQTETYVKEWLKTNR